METRNEGAPLRSSADSRKGNNPVARVTRENKNSGRLCGSRRNKSGLLSEKERMGEKRVKESSSRDKRRHALHDTAWHSARVRMTKAVKEKNSLACAPNAGRTAEKGIKAYFSTEKSRFTDTDDQSQRKNNADLTCSR